MRPAVWIPAFALLLTAALTPVSAQDANEDSGAPPPVYFVLIHSPGKAWVDSLPSMQQPGITNHVRYMASFLDEGKLLMGGPFMDNSGGMMVFRTVDRKEAEKIAAEDPAVKSGILNVDVKPWMVPLSSDEE